MVEDDTPHGRLHWYLPEELDAEQRKFYDDLTSGPRGSSVLDEKGRLTGAMNARLLDPPVGTAIQQLGAAIRFGSKISDRGREIAILETFVHDRNNFEWPGHSKIAREAGLTDADIEAIRTGGDSPGFTPEERVLRRVAESIVQRGDVDDDLFAEAERAIGLVSLFDVISAIGHYQHTGLALKIWRVPQPEGTTLVFNP